MANPFQLFDVVPDTSSSCDTAGGNKFKVTVELDRFEDSSTRSATLEGPGTDMADRD